MNDNKWPNKWWKIKGCPVQGFYFTLLYRVFVQSNVDRSNKRKILAYRSDAFCKNLSFTDS